MAEGHPPAAAMAIRASYRRSRLPFARPQTSKPPKVRPAPQGKGTPTSPTRATPARKSHHKATAMAEGHPPAAAMAIRASYRRSRLPFARPQTLQTLQKSAQLRREKVPQQAQHRHARTQKTPQSHSNGSRAPRGRSNGFFWAFNAAVCEASNPPNASNASKALATPNSARKRYPNRHHAQHCKQKPPQQVPDKATAMAQSRLLIMGIQGCRLPSLKLPKASNV